MAYPIISLFSGAMGLDLGLHRAGLDVRVAQDFEPSCVATMEANHQPHIAGDIRELMSTDPTCQRIQEVSGLGVGDAFAIVGGPPCQPFSTAGRREAFGDPRGSLFREFVHAVDVLRPRFFVMENVRGLVSAAIRKATPETAQDMETQPGSALRVMLSEWESLGYSVIWGVLDAVHYGVPQFRERLIIMGSRDHETLFLPQPTHFSTHQRSEYRWRTLRDAIADLEQDPGVFVQFSPQRLTYLAMLKEGQNWRDLPEDVVADAMGGAWTSSGGRTGMYRKLRWDEPSPTLVTSPTQKTTMRCHPTQLRPLSVREYARIQQFPDDWVIAGTPAAMYRQIGNAVPVGLGQAIGDTLIAMASGQMQIHSPRIRSSQRKDDVACGD